MTGDTRPRFDAVILAGGRGTRLGGVDKASIVLHGARLVDRVVSAAHGSGAIRTVVVGPVHAATAATHTIREDPPFSGPLTAAIAGLELVQEANVMLLACDLVNPEAICAALVGDAFRTDSTESVVLRDTDGFPQWLAGLHPTAPLRAAAARMGGEAANQPVRRLFAEVSPRFIDASHSVTGDIDSPDDLDRARRSSQA